MATGWLSLLFLVALSPVACLLLLFILVRYRLRVARDLRVPSRRIQSSLAVGIVATAVGSIPLFWLGRNFLTDTTAGKRRLAEMQLERVCQGLILYRLDHGTLPSTADGLTSLAARDSSFPASQLIDPWGEPFRYRRGPPVVLVSVGDPAAAKAPEIRHECKL